MRASVKANGGEEGAQPVAHDACEPHDWDLIAAAVFGDEKFGMRNVE